jgi:iron complex transport system substrate-binding protein
LASRGAGLSPPAAATVAGSLACLLCLACAREESPRAGSLRLIDDLGRSVALVGPASRVVSLSPAATEILFAVGCGSRLVLRDSWSDQPREARAVPAISGFSPSVEALLAARPDLVLLSAAPPDLARGLAAGGVPWLVLVPADLGGVARDMIAVGLACGRRASGQRAAALLERQVSAVRRRVAGRPRPRVFYEMDAGGGRPWTVGRASFGHALIEAAGGINVFADAQVPWLQVSTEAIVTRDPEVVLLADTDGIEDPQGLEAVLARPGWGVLRAVRSRRVYALDGDLVSRPGPRLAAGLDAIAGLLHPTARTGPGGEP